MSSQVKPWLVLGVIFLAGIATGCALTVVLLPHFLPPPGEGQMAGHFMAFLTHRLDLTADQQAKIQPIVADATMKLQALHHDEVSHGSQIMQDVHEKIAAFLTPEQKAELQKLESERQKMFFGHMRPGGPERDGPGPMHHFGGPEGDGMAPPQQPAPDAPPNEPPPQRP